MDDFVMIETISGAHGELANAMKCFHSMNDGLTKVWDCFLGPNGTDTFDASCNTCKHFERKPMSPEEKRDRNICGMPGHCAKKDIPTIGWHRGQYCGFENEKCYENRRTGMTPIEFSIQLREKMKHG